MTEPGTRVRRRLSDDRAQRRLPIGCMAWGAVLGILAGIMIALYALPPVLRSIYGEKHVDAGEVYEADGKRIEVLDVAREEPVFRITLRVLSSQTWALTEDDWQVEVTTQDGRAKALQPDPGEAVTGFTIVPGDERTLVLRFAAPGRADAYPAVLHLASPRVAFELR